MAAKKVLLIHHMLAMGEVVLLTSAYKVIKENWPSASITVIAGGYAEVFLKTIPWVDKVLPIESFGIFLGKIPRLKKILLKPFTVLMFSYFIRKNGFNIVFMRNDERLPHTKLVRMGVIFSGKREVISLKPLMDIYFSPKQHVVQSYCHILKHIGFNVGNDVSPELTVTVSGINKGKEFLYINNINVEEDKIIGFSPVSKLKIKTWDAKLAADFCDLILKYNSHKILIFTTDQEYISRVKQFIRSDNITFVGHMDFKDLTSLISLCSLYISVDTGPMHVAAACGVPTLGLFGPTSGTMFGPYGKNCSFIQKTPECSYYKPEAFFSSKEEFQLCYVNDRCFMNDRSCVDFIIPENVIMHLENMCLL